MDLFVVIGDVHGEIAAAVAALESLEHDFGAPIAQVFSVGDFGLFLSAEDWNYLTGPKRYRKPEMSASIAAGLGAWHWPLAMIGGNHEPFHRLRIFDPDYFGQKLTYTNAGELPHSLHKLRVYGLSGIGHAEHLGYGEVENSRMPKPHTWGDLLALVRSGKATMKRLTYYKREEIDRLKALPPNPHLLLTHDWPMPPSGCLNLGVERELAQTLQPQFLCSGHHHRAGYSMMGQTTCLGLNIIREAAHEGIRPGWAAVFAWNGDDLMNLGFWPGEEGKTCT